MGFSLHYIVMLATMLHMFNKFFLVKIVVRLDNWPDIKYIEFHLCILAGAHFYYYSDLFA